MKRIAIVWLGACLAGGALAQAGGTDHDAHHAPTVASAPSADAASSTWTEGEVRRIDKEQGKVTLRHGRIAKLDMQPMTMVFRAADPALLANLKVGDKVRFDAANVNGELTVTGIEGVKP